MFRALTGLKLTMPNLIGIFAFYIAGYYFAKTTKQLNLIKAFFVLILGYFVSNILSTLLGIYTLAFILGFLSNTGYFIFRIVLWVHSLRELFFFLQHRTVAEDIYEREDSAHTKTTSSHDSREEKFEKSFSSKSHKKPESNAWKPSNVFSATDYKKCMKILVLQPPFTQKEIKKAYRRMAMKYHPDIQATGDQEKFVLGSAAYEYLDKFYAQFVGHQKIRV